MSNYADSKFINKFTHFFDAWPLAQVSHNSIFLEDGSPWYQLSTDIVKYMWNDKTHPAERIKSRNVYGGRNVYMWVYKGGAMCTHDSLFWSRGLPSTLFLPFSGSPHTMCPHPYVCKLWHWPQKQLFVWPCVLVLPRGRLILRRLPYIFSDYVQVTQVWHYPGDFLDLLENLR